jgi:hypothetical protein
MHEDVAVERLGPDGSRSGHVPHLSEARRSWRTPDDTLELLEKYRWDAQYLSAGHYLAAKRLARWGYTIAVLAIGTASIASTSVFASLSTERALGWRITTGLLAAAAAGFAAIQTLMKFDDRAGLHKNFGARFTEIRDVADRHLIRLKHLGERPPDEMMDEAADVARQLTEAAKQAPDLPDRDYDRARASFRGPRVAWWRRVASGLRGRGKRSSADSTRIR